MDKKIKIKYYLQQQDQELLFLAKKIVASHINKIIDLQ
jgi:hypothetical protein